jgi:flagellar biosynthesis protein FliR
MHSELSIQLGTLYGFLLVLARLAGVFVFIPLPGISAGPKIARAMLSLFMTFTLFPEWPHVDAAAVTLPVLIGWLICEAGIGIGAGVAVSFITEVFLMGAQLVALQAGYGFAAMVDPATQNETSVLTTAAQLAAGLLFFAVGLDRQILAIFAQSLQAHPPGTFLITRPFAEQIIQLGAGMFSTGFQLVLPILALLLMVDLSLALLGRLNQQMQLIMLAFPIKMLLAVVLLAWLVLLFPQLMTGIAEPIFGVLRHFLI